MLAGAAATEVACAQPPMRTIHAGAGSCTAGVCLALTVGTDPPPACATTMDISVATGTAVNFCYTLTNQSGIELDYHTLGDSLNPQIFWLLDQPVANGASYQYNRVVTIRDDAIVNATWTAQDTQPDYTDTATGSGFVDITGIGTPLGIQDEGIVSATMPFAFDFYGRTSTHVCISSDGYVLFDLMPCPAYLYYSSQPLPTDYLYASAFLPLWEELIVGNGEVYSATLGAAPNRRFVIEWYQRPPYGATDGFTFELILDEGTNRISFEYQDVDTSPPAWSDGALATIGLQADSTHANEYSYFTASVTSGSGIEWMPTPIQTFTANASATIHAGGPVMTLAPAALHANLLTGTSTNTTFTISNGGDVDLNWSLAEAPGLAAHPAQPQGTLPIPAFAEDLSSGQFVTFNANDPTTLTPIASTDYQLTGGDFVVNDPTRLYALDGSGGPHGNTLVTVDTTSGATTEIGPAVPLGTASWSSLKWDQTTQTLYAVAADCTFTNSTLYTIDRGSGAAARVASISTGDRNCVMSIAISPDGQMYGIDLVNPDSLVAIDKNTGAATRIGQLGVTANENQAMDFDDASGVLYWARRAEVTPGQFVSEIRTINTTTGASTLVGEIGSGAPVIDAFAIGATGDCAAPQDIPWLSLNPTSGTTAPGTGTDVDVTLDASAIPAGTYRATICAYGNDPDAPIEQIPVEIDVIDANDVIFRDGFDGG